MANNGSSSCVDVIARALAAKAMQGGGAVSSVNGKTGDVVLVPADLGIGTVFTLKGSKETTADLPASGNEIGDVWYVTAESVGYIWLNDGATDRWEQLGLPIDLSAYSTTAQMNAAIATAIGNAIGGAY